MSFIKFIFGSLGGIGLGMLMAFMLYTFPRGVITRHVYCTQCGLHRIRSKERQILGARTRWENRSGAVHRLLASAAGEHKHRFIRPGALVFPSYPKPSLSGAEAFQQEVVRREVRELEELENWPKAIALLYAAKRNNERKAIQLIRRILDPAAYVPISVIRLLERRLPWAQRWAVVQAFFRHYRCRLSAASVTCTLPDEDKRIIVFRQDAKRVTAGGISWRRWQPPGGPATKPAVDPAATPKPKPRNGWRRWRRYRRRPATMATAGGPTMGTPAMTPTMSPAMGPPPRRPPAMRGPPMGPPPRRAPPRTMTPSPPPRRR